MIKILHTKNVSIGFNLYVTRIFVGVIAAYIPKSEIDKIHSSIPF